MSTSIPSSTFHTSDVELTLHEALSGIMASISLSAWIFFLLPQLLENRRNQSGEAVSMTFILLRFASDICNLVGGILAGILPGIIAVAVDYCVTDVLLVAQILYYGVRNRRIEGKAPVDATVETLKGNLEPVDEDLVEDASNKVSHHETSPSADRGSNDENSPLLQQQNRRNSSRDAHSQQHYDAFEHPIDHLTDALDEGGSQSVTHIWLKDLGFVLVVIIFGIVGWTLAYHTKVWTPKPDEGATSNMEGEDVIKKSASQVLGYASAALSLGCRIPQIVRNWRYKSCEGESVNDIPEVMIVVSLLLTSWLGLSLLFFLLSLIGNLTYGAGILFHSTEKEYVIKNTPWLVGSLGTMVQDITIFFQFHVYRQSDR